MTPPLVSIIIPTYNRAHLIGETLDSVLKQTYKNWECIVVDDGSTDGTDELLTAYCKKDPRFQYHYRPSNRLKGANACRNYGFELSKGEYVNWFDSDDLMFENNIELKVGAIDNQFDFFIGNSINFDDIGNVSRPYSLNYDLVINPIKYIKGHIGWITNDVLIRRRIIKIQFNEKLKSGQEYNFFSRLLFESQNITYIKKDLSLRRIHGNSIQGELLSNKEKNEVFYWKNTVNNWVYLLEDIKMIDAVEEKKWLINSIILFSFNIGMKREKIPQIICVLKNILKNGGVVKLTYFLISLISVYLTNRGYKIMKYARK